eukprot:539998-Pleurochrysis_carterae.AAC.1
MLPRRETNRSAAKLSPDERLKLIGEDVSSNHAEISCCARSLGMVRSARRGDTCNGCGSACRSGRFTINALIRAGVRVKVWNFSPYVHAIREMILSEVTQGSAIKSPTAPSPCFGSVKCVEKVVPSKGVGSPGVIEMIDV